MSYHAREAYSSPFHQRLGRFPQPVLVRSGTGNREFHGDAVVQGGRYNRRQVEDSFLVLLEDPVIDNP